jgi:hypothetical protein
MSYSRPFQWYHSHADTIWPDGTFNCGTTDLGLTEGEACKISNKSISEQNVIIIIWLYFSLFSYKISFIFQN